jgi:hypothetical protein
VGVGGLGRGGQSVNRFPCVDMRRETKGRKRLVVIGGVSLLVQTVKQNIYFLDLLLPSLHFIIF